MDNMQIENSNLEKKEGIYITSPEIIEKGIYNKLLKLYGNDNG